MIKVSVRSIFFIYDFIKKDKVKIVRSDCIKAVFMFKIKIIEENKLTITHSQTRLRIKALEEHDNRWKRSRVVLLRVISA